MKKLERLSMVAAMLLFSAMMTFAQQRYYKKVEYRRMK